MVTTRRRQVLEQQQQQQQRRRRAAEGSPAGEARAVLAPAESAEQPASPPHDSPLTPTAAPPPEDGNQPAQQGQPPQLAAPGPAPAQLKSALKALQPAADGVAGGAVAPAAAEATPEGCGIKKRVRIHSSNNIIHVFPTSGSSGRQLGAAEGEEGWEDGPGGSGDAARQARYGRAGVCQRRAVSLLGTPTLLRYQAFIRGIRGGAGAPDGGGDAAGSPQPGSPTSPAAAGGGGAPALPRRRGSRPPVLLPWAAVASILGWMAASSALIFVNKAIMVDRGFRFPFALTAAGSAVSTLLGLVASWAGLAPLRPHPSLRETLTKLLPVALCTAASLFLGNAAYLGLSVAFINILKALTPVVTLCAGLLLGQERPSLPVAAAMGLIASGTAMSTAQESSSGHFSWQSFAYFMLSMVFEALRVVCVERMMGRQRYNAVEVLVYIGPLTMLLLLAGACLTERHLLLEEGLAIVGRHPLLFLAAMVVSFLVNAFSFLAIQASSSLTFKVSGCLKNTVVVGVGVALGDSLTAKEALGYSLSLLGFLGYTLLRSSDHGQQQQQQSRGVKQA